MVMVVVAMAVSGLMLCVVVVHVKPQFLALAAQVVGHFLVHVLEHRGSSGCRAALLGLFLRAITAANGGGGLVFFFGPVADLDQVLPNRVTQREVAPVIGGAVLGRVVRGVEGGPAR